MADINNFLMPVDTNISLDKVILSQENKDKIEMFIREIKYRGEFERLGLTPMNRLLFYGASGTGKTFLAKALSNHLGFKMLYVDIAKTLSDNTVAQNMAEIFAIAEKEKNCIIFLDECDSITMSRYAMDYGDSAQVRRATNSLFQQLDQMSPYNIFIAATNLLFKIDPAFERRMNLKLEFRRPELNLIEAIQKFMLPGFKFVDDVDDTTKHIVDMRAADSKKLSYYEIQGLVERAMKDAVLSGHRTVRSSTVYTYLSKAMNMKLRFKTDTDPEEMYQHPVDNFNN